MLKCTRVLDQLFLLFSYYLLFGLVWIPFSGRHRRRKNPPLLYRGRTETLPLFLPVPAPNTTHAYCPADRPRERFDSSQTQGIRGGANPVFRESLVVPCQGPRDAIVLGVYYKTAGDNLALLGEPTCLA